MAPRTVVSAWSRRASLGALVAATLVTTLVPGAAVADVRHEGALRDDDPEVTLDVDNVSRVEALKRLADAAGWSVVLNVPKGEPVTVHAKDLPASKLLDVLLADGRYVARLDDKLLAIGPDTMPAPSVSAPPIPAQPPVPPSTPGADVDDDDGPDRMVTGGSVRIESSEVVRDVTVMGGNLEVSGTVTGDLLVMGGHVVLHRGARVKGDVSSLGGSLTVEQGASVDGDVGVLGGSLHREDGARIGGEVHEGMRHTRHHHEKRHGATKAAAAPVTTTKPPDKPTPGKFARAAADAINGAALLFVLGAVLLALAPDRMDKLRIHIASHPMKSFALGVVGLLGGIVLGALVCLTIIGIPFVIVGILAAIVGTLAAMCSVLETIGGAFLAHRTKNPYVHLAFGGLLFLVAGAIPFIGGFVKAAVILTALGSLVGTRAAGLIPTKLRGGPYRTNGLVDAPV
jgi:cytoskeletal protein CcmA (bactofilin family)